MKNLNIISMVDKIILKRQRNKRVINKVLLKVLKSQYDIKMKNKYIMKMKSIKTTKSIILNHLNSNIIIFNQLLAGLDNKFNQMLMIINMSHLDLLVIIKMFIMKAMMKSNDNTRSFLSFTNCIKWKKRERMSWSSKRNKNWHRFKEKLRLTGKRNHKIIAAHKIHTFHQHIILEEVYNYKQVKT